MGLQTLAKTSHKSSGLNTRTNVRLTQTSGNTHSRKTFARVSIRVKDLILAAAKPLDRTRTPTRTLRPLSLVVPTARVFDAVSASGTPSTASAPLPSAFGPPTPWRDGCLDGRKGGVPRGGRREEPRPLGARARVYRRFDATGSTNLINWYFPSRRIAGIARARASAGAPHRRGPPRFLGFNTCVLCSGYRGKNPPRPQTDLALPRPP